MPHPNLAVLTTVQVDFVSGLGYLHARARMCTHVRAPMHVCMHTHTTNMCTCALFLCVWTCAPVCVHVCMYVCMCEYTCVWMCVHVRTCVITFSSCLSEEPHKKAPWELKGVRGTLPHCSMKDGCNMLTLQFEKVIMNFFLIIIKRTAIHDKWPGKIKPEES